MIGFRPGRNMQRGRRARTRLGEWARRRDRGQAIILVTFVFIALALLTGLVVDGGTVLARYAQLRRSVDAAAVQASNQFREFRPLYSTSGGDMYHAATQVVEAQGLDSSSIRVYACTGSGPSVQVGPDTAPIPPEATGQLCTTPPRKLVRVDGQVIVGLPFLSLVGWRNVTVKATSVAEAAGIDLTLVLDRSSSMSNDTSGSTDPVACAATRSCKPFEDVRTNAMTLVNKLYFPYDRVVLIEFDRLARVYNPTANEFQPFASIDVRNTNLLVSDRATAINALNNPTNDTRLFIIDQCVTLHGCTTNNMPGVDYPANTNTGGALRAATTVLAVQARLRGAVWMMLLLSDGAPNATDAYGGYANGFCPPSTWSYGGVYTVPGYGNGRPADAPYAYPYCRRLNVAAGSGTTPDSDSSYAQIKRVCIYTDTSKCAPSATINRDTDSSGYQDKYDATDYARDQADYMAGNGIVAFVIGLGSEVSGASGNQSTRLYITAPGSPSNYSREPNAGERLLRYVADVGTQPNLWQCHSNYWVGGTTEVSAAEHCGNYWFAASGSSLQPIFDAIANRIFTRIAQ